MPRSKSPASLGFGRRLLLISLGEDDTIAEDGEAFPRMPAARAAASVIPTEAISGSLNVARGTAR